MNKPGFEELRIPLRHLTLSAKAWGRPSDRPLLALHGWLDNAGSFDRIAPLLEGRYLVALDLAGHGKSDHRPPATWYPYADFLDDIAGVMAWFGWSSTDLLGHSLGATLASTFAAINPDKVNRLLLIEGLGPLTQTAEKTLEQLRRSQAARAAFKGDGLRVFASLEEAIEARCRSGQLSAQAARCIVERGVKAVGVRDLAGASGAGRGETVAPDGFVESGTNHNGDGDSGSERNETGVLAGFIESGNDQKRDGDIGLGGDVAGAVSGICERGVDQERDRESGLEKSQALHFLSWSSDPQLTIPSATRLTEEQLAAVLPAIVAPTLLVLAQPHAPYLQPAVMKARVALVPDIDVVHLAGTHHLHLEDPAPVAAVLNRFLQAKTAAA
jgi:pimeloyl-ACP methyl ester carboxylesterase